MPVLTLAPSAASRPPEHIKFEAESAARRAPTSGSSTDRGQSLSESQEDSDSDQPPGKMPRLMDN